MPVLAPNPDVTERSRIFRAVVSHFGKIQPAAFFQNTNRSLPGVVRLHNLASGIFKPKDSVYALCITSMLSSPYADQVFYNPDRTWWMHYSPKSGGMDQAANVALVRCMTDHQPVLVAKQVSDKAHRDGSRYRLLGLGYVEHFDVAADLFRIRGMEWVEVSAVLGLGLSDELVESETVASTAPIDLCCRATLRIALDGFWHCLTAHPRLHYDRPLLLLWRHGPNARRAVASAKISHVRLVQIDSVRCSGRR